MKKITQLTIFIFSLIVFSSCEKILDFEPKGDGVLLAEDALQSEADYQALLNSIYDVEANYLGGQCQNLSELLADNLDQPNNHEDYTQVWRRGTNFFNGTIDGVYGDAYIAIYRANVILQDIENTSVLSADAKQRMGAEARFLRALNHFTIVRQYAQPYGFTANNSHLGIIVKTEPNHSANSRGTVNEAYEQILADLLYAEANLPEENGIYATANAARALLAKVYLDMRDWTNAYQFADAVINSGKYALGGLDRFAPGTSSESIFEIVSTPPNDERGTAFKNNYRSDGANASPQFRASAELYANASADTNDLRFKNWYRVIDADSPDEFIGIAKFDYSNMNVPVLHFTEMKLIRAEAAGELKQFLSTAETDLNDLRQRANLEPISLVSGAAIVAEAHAQRRLEMVFEGDRVHQLKRMALQGYVTEIRNAPWDCNGMILQFPNTEGTVQNFVFNPEGGCN